MNPDGGGLGPAGLDSWSPASRSVLCRSTFKHTVLCYELQTKLSIGQAVVLREVVWCHGNTVQIPETRTRIRSVHVAFTSCSLTSFHIVLQTQKATNSRDASSCDRFMIQLCWKQKTSLRFDYSLEAVLPS